MSAELIVTIALAVLGLAAALLRIFKDSAEKAESKAKLAKAEQVVAAIGAAVNTVTPLLGVDKARTLKSTIKGNASAAGVLGDLDGLLKRHGLNDRSTAELANPH